MSSRIESDDSFLKVPSRFELAMGQSPTSDVDPFNLSGKWEALGDQVALDDISYETGITVQSYRSDYPDQALVSVRASFWQMGDVYVRRAEVILVDSTETSATKWEAYLLDGNWQGEWTALAPELARSTANLIKSGQFKIVDRQ